MTPDQEAAYYIRHKFTDLICANTVEETRALLEKGYNPNKTYGHLEVTALFAAKTPEQAEVLLRAGADPNHRTKRGDTPLSWISCPDTQEVLKSYGAK